MRVLFFIGGLGTGGAERQFAQLSYSLAQRGHDVSVATIYAGGQNWQWLQKQDSVKLFNLFGKKPENRSMVLLQLISAARRLQELVCHERVSTVYSALYLSNLIAWLAVKNMQEIQLVWGIRASNLQLNWKRNIPFRLCRWVSSSVPMIISNSRSGLVYHEKKGYRAKIRIAIPNGIDTNRFYYDPQARNYVRSKWGVADEEILIGLVGRIDPMKGHTVFLKAAAKASKEYKNLRFVCVGGGPEKIKNKLQELSYKLGLRESIIWTGESSDTHYLYSAFDIATSSSSYGEGFPNIIGEAMSCRVPCVVTNVGDSAYLIGDAGYVIEPNNPDKLTEAWIKLLNLSEDQRKELGLRARRRIETKFTIGSSAIETEQALLRLSMNCRAGKGLN